MEITVMALERELRSNKRHTAKSLNYSVFNQMSQQQAGRGVNMSHQSFLSTQQMGVHPRCQSRSPDDRVSVSGTYKTDNASTDQAQISASLCYPSPISHHTN